MPVSLSHPARRLFMRRTAQLAVAGIALPPIGKTIVTKEVAEAARAANAATTVAAVRDRN